MPTPLHIYVKIILTALFWGGTWIAGRVAVREVSPLAIASWRFLLASVILGVVLTRREGRPVWTARDWAEMALLGLTGVFFYNLFFLNGLQRVEAGRGALVTALIPAVIALIDWVFLATPLSLPKLGGVILALVGCLLVITHGQPQSLLRGEIGSGECLLLGCVLAWAIYTLASRRLAPRFSPLGTAFGGCVTGWAMLTAAALIDGSLFTLDQATWRGVSGIVFLGVFGTAFALTWYAEAIAHMGTTRAAAFINLVPVCAVLMGALLLDEHLGSAVLGGGALVVIGVALTNRATPARTPAK